MSRLAGARVFEADLREQVPGRLGEELERSPKTGVGLVLRGKLVRSPLDLLELLRSEQLRHGRDGSRGAAQGCTARAADKTGVEEQPHRRKPTEEQIQVREVTHVRASWTGQEGGARRAHDRLAALARSLGCDKLGEPV